MLVSECFRGSFELRFVRIRSIRVPFWYTSQVTHCTRSIRYAKRDYRGPGLGFGARERSRFNGTERKCRRGSLSVMKNTSDSSLEKARSASLPTSHALSSSPLASSPHSSIMHMEAMRAKIVVGTGDTAEAQGNDRRIVTTALNRDGDVGHEERGNENQKCEGKTGGLTEYREEGIYTHPVSIVYENQRWIGLTWIAPIALLDYAGFSDENGNPVILDAPPTKDPDPSKWRVIVSPATDKEGWEYGTVFQHLSRKRPGGRASQRLGDAVRRRAWMRTDHKVAGRAMEGFEDVKMKRGANGGRFLSEKERLEEAAAAAARESAAKRQAIRSFAGIVMDLLSRKKLWNIVPWDPSVLPVIQQRHQDTYLKWQQHACDHNCLRANDTTYMPSILGENRTLLQDLLLAATHSRAAYGFAMEAGHVSSVAAYVKLHTLQQLSFDAASGASEESNTEAVSSLTGIPVEDILEASWKNSPYRPCHYVAIDRSAQCVIVSIRGSLEIGDLLSDLTAHPMEISLRGIEGSVHQGMLVAASYIHCATQAALEAAATQVPGWPILLTGHSLGGGVAALLYMLLQESGGISGLGNIRAIGIGPAAVMSSSLAASCEKDVLSVVLGSDIIPHLSYSSVEHLLEEMVEASPLRRAAEGIGKKLTELLSLTKKANNTSPPAEEKQKSGKLSADKAKNIPYLSQNTWRLLRSAAQVENIDRGHFRTGGLADVKSLSENKNRKANVNSAPRTASTPMVPVVDLNIPDNTSEVEMQRKTQERKNQPQSKDQGELNGSHVSSLLEEKGLDSSSMDQNSPNKTKDTMEYCDSGPDGTMINTAMSRHCNDISSHFLEDIPPGNSLNLQDDSGVENRTNKNPDILYPAGKILWIFPSNESMLSTKTEGLQTESLTKSDNEVNDFDGKSASAVVDELWDLAWEGGSEMGTIDEAKSFDHEKSESSGQFSESQPCNGTIGNGIDKKEKAAETSVGQSSGKKPSVATQADRVAFERLLLLPDCLDDHLPDRYLESLKKF